jgi:hypothetical protein
MILTNHNADSTTVPNKSMQHNCLVIQLIKKLSALMQPENSFTRTRSCTLQQNPSKSEACLILYHMLII